MERKRRSRAEHARQLALLSLIGLYVYFLFVGNSQLGRAQTMAVWPQASWAVAAPVEVGMDEAKLNEAMSYALTGGGAGYITRHGYLIKSWGSPTERFSMKSTTKSIGVTALGLAIGDGLMGLHDPSQGHHSSFGIPPLSNADTGWLDDISQLHLATHTAGFDKPGGYVSLLFEPGTTWSYSDAGANWLAETLTLTYNRDLKALLFERVFTPIEIPTSHLTWSNNSYRDDLINGVINREFGSGIRATVDAMARIGYLYLHNGLWEDAQIIPASFVDQVRNTPVEIMGLPVNKPAAYPNASKHYGLFWWNNNDGTLENVPRDAYWAWGLGDSLIVVVPSLDIVATRAGNGWRTGWNGNYAVIEPFIEPIVLSVTGSGSPSPVPSVTPTPTDTPSITPTDTQIATDAPTATQTDTPVLTDTPAATLTETPAPTDTPTVTPTDLSFPTETPTSTPTPTDTPAATPAETLVVTGTPTPTLTDTPVPVDTNTPTPGVGDLIFADGFETGDLLAWSSAATDGGDLSVTSMAALGGSFGLQANLNDSTAIYLVDKTPNAEHRYRARFYIDPNSLTMTSGVNHLIFRASSGSKTVLKLLFRLSSNGYQVQANVLNDASNWKPSSWVMLTDASHAIEIDWRASSSPSALDGGITLWIDGVKLVDMVGVDNDTWRIDEVRLGALEVSTGTQGAIYFDTFESRRSTYIGP